MSKGKGASSKSTADMRPSAPAKTATSVPPPPPGSPHRTSASMTCVSSLSLTSSPASANDSNMVSPDKTKKRAVRCLDEDLASTKQTAALLQHSAALGSSLTSSCLDVETTQNTKRPNNKRGKLEADYVCLMLLKTVMAQDSSVAAMLKEQGAKTSKKDLFALFHRR